MENEQWMPLVSIITVTYNSEKFLKDTIESVLKQSYPNIEYIIIDGGSSDKTISILRKYSDSIRFWCSEPDCGIYDAMNKGIMRSSGEIIGIINSDDWYEPNAVKLVVDKLRSLPNIGVVHGDMKMHTENSCPMYVVQPDLDNSNLWFSLTINHPSCFIRRSVYEKLGCFNPEYQLIADHEMFLRFWIQGEKFVYIKKLLVNMRAGGVSQKKLKQANKEYLAMLKQHGKSRFFIVLIFLYKSSRAAVRKTMILMGFSGLVQRIGFLINRRYAP